MSSFFSSLLRKNDSSSSPPPSQNRQKGGGSQKRANSQQQQQQQQQMSKQRRELFEIIIFHPSRSFQQQRKKLETNFGMGETIVRTMLNTMTVQKQMLRQRFELVGPRIKEETLCTLRLKDPILLNTGWDISFFYHLQTPRQFSQQIVQKVQEIRKHYRMIHPQMLSQDIQWPVEQEGILFPCVEIKHWVIGDQQVMTMILPLTPVFDHPFFRRLFHYTPSDFYVFDLPRPTDTSVPRLIQHLSIEMEKLKTKCHDFAMVLENELWKRISKKQMSQTSPRPMNDKKQSRQEIFKVMQQIMKQTSR